MSVKTRDDTLYTQSLHGETICEYEYFQWSKYEHRLCFGKLGLLGHISGFLRHCLGKFKTATAPFHFPGDIIATFYFNNLNSILSLWSQMEQPPNHYQILYYFYSSLFRKGSFRAWRTEDLNIVCPSVCLVWQLMLKGGIRSIWMCTVQSEMYSYAFPLRNKLSAEAHSFSLSLQH